MVVASKSSLPVLTIFNPKPPHSHTSKCSSLLISSHLSSISILSTKRCKLYLNSPPHTNSLSKPNQNWEISATPESLKLAEVTAVENTEQIVATTSGDGVSNIISVLLFIAFVGLSVLTIGVIYIAVTDYLQKREREKFEKEESGKKKKGNKKKKVRARAGPRGFGQKIDEVDDDDDD